MYHACYNKRKVKVKICFKITFWNKGDQKIKKNLKTFLVAF